MYPLSGKPRAHCYLHQSSLTVFSFHPLTLSFLHSFWPRSPSHPLLPAPPAPRGSKMPATLGSPLAAEAPGAQICTPASFMCLLSAHLMSPSTGHFCLLVYFFKKATRLFLRPLVTETHQSASHTGFLPFYFKFGKSSEVNKWWPHFNSSDRTRVS